MRYPQKPEKTFKKCKNVLEKLINFHNSDKMQIHFSGVGGEKPAFREIFHNMESYYLWWIPKKTFRKVVRIC